MQSAYSPTSHFWQRFHILSLSSVLAEQLINSDRIFFFPQFESLEERLWCEKISTEQTALRRKNKTQSEPLWINCRKSGSCPFRSQSLPSFPHVTAVQEAHSEYGREAVGSSWKGPRGSFLSLWGGVPLGRLELWASHWSSWMVGLWLLRCDTPVNFDDSMPDLNGQQVPLHRKVQKGSPTPRKQFLAFKI